MAYIAPLGRILYCYIFLTSFYGHFTQGTVDYASGHGLPFANVLVPASGVVLLLGAVSITLGYKAKIGGWLIVLFLLPVTLMMHNFWAIEDPAQAAFQEIMFKKNLSMLGAAFLISYFGAGPLSLDAWLKARSVPNPS